MKNLSCRFYFTVLLVSLLLISSYAYSEFKVWYEVEEEVDTTNRLITKKYVVKWSQAKSPFHTYKAYRKLLDDEDFEYVSTLHLTAETDTEERRRWEVATFTSTYDNGQDYSEATYAAGGLACEEMDEEKLGTYKILCDCGEQGQVDVMPENSEGDDCREECSPEETNLEVSDSACDSCTMSSNGSSPVGFRIHYDSGERETEFDAGPGWTHEYDMRLMRTFAGDGNSASYVAYMGSRKLRFFRDYSGNFHSVRDDELTIEQFTEASTDKIRIVMPDDVMYIFPKPTANGWDNAEKIEKIMRIYARENDGGLQYKGYWKSFAYNGNGLLQYLVEGEDSAVAANRRLQFDYTNLGTQEDPIWRLQYVKAYDYNGGSPTTVTKATLSYYTAANTYNLNTFTNARSKTYTYTYDGTDKHKLVRRDYPGGEKDYYKYHKVFTDDGFPVSVYYRRIHYTSDGEDDHKLERLTEYHIELDGDEVDRASSYVKHKVARRMSGENPVYSETKTYMKYSDTYSHSNDEYDDKKIWRQKIEDELGNTTEYRYDSDGNLFWKELSDGSSYYLTTRYSYNDEEDLIGVITRKSNQSDSITINAGQDPVDDMWDVEYVYVYNETDDEIEKVTRKDALGRESVMEYLKEDNYMTKRVECTYLKDGANETNKTEYIYYPDTDADRKFKLWKVRDPRYADHGKETIYDWNLDGTLKTVTDHLGRVTKYNYDYDTSGSYSQPASIEVLGENGWLKTEYTYDAAGQTTKIKYPKADPDADQFETQFNYTDDDKLSQKTHKYGTSTLKTLSYSYENDTGLLSSVSQTSPGSYTLVSYSYYLDGSIKELTSGGNTKIGYEYNNAGWLTKKKIYTDDQGTSNDTSYTYNPDRSVNTMTDPRSITTTYHYDAENSEDKKTNRLSRTQYPNDDDMYYDYYDNGMTHRIGTKTGDPLAWDDYIRYYYDSYNRLYKVRDVHGKEIEVTQFFENGTPERLKYPGFTGANPYIEYTVDDLNRITQIKNKADGDRTAKYYYYEETGQLEKVELPNGTTANYVYDDLGRLTSLANKRSDNDVINSFAYSYKNTCACTNLGLVEKITFEDGRFAKYAYDNLEHLTKEEYRNAQNALLNSYEYTYDADGNRLEKIFDDSATERIYYSSDASDTTPPEAFDESNQLKKMWTGSGKTTSRKLNVTGTIDEDNVDTITVTASHNSGAESRDPVTPQIIDDFFVARGIELWNDDDNEVEVNISDKTGNEDSDTETGIELDDTLDVRFTYDNNGNMTSKVEEYGTQDERTTTYHWNDRNLLKQIDFPDSTTAYITYDGLGRPVQIEYSPITRKFVFLGTNIVQEYDGSDSLENEYVTNVATREYIYGKDDSSNYYYYHFDKDRNVAAITDGSKDLQAWYEYDCFGNILTDADSTDNDFRYGSAFYDEKSSLLYKREDFYSPEIGRYIRRQESNRYTIEKMANMMRMRSPRSRCVTCAGSSNYQGSGPRGGTNALITRTALIVLLMLVLLPLRTKTLWKRASLKPLRAYATIVVCFLLVGVIISGCGRNRCSGLTPPKKGGTWQWYPTGAIDTGAINLLVPEGCTCRCFYQNRYCWRNKKDGVDCCVDGNNPTAINGTIGTDEKCHCDWPSINPAEGKIPIGGAYEKDSRGEEFNWEQKRI